jgi:hypothetical protein
METVKVLFSEVDIKNVSNDLFRINGYNPSSKEMEKAFEYLAVEAHPGFQVVSFKENQDPYHLEYVLHKKESAI